jgi:hypothetical protein
MCRERCRCTVEHRLHRLLCPRCSTSTCAELPQGVETSHYGPRLSSLVGLLGSAFPLSIGKTSELLERLLGVSISGGAIVAIRARLAGCLREPMEEALREARLQPVTLADDLEKKQIQLIANVIKMMKNDKGAGDGCA